MAVVQEGLNHLSEVFSGGLMTGIRGRVPVTLSGEAASRTEITLPTQFQTAQ